MKYILFILLACAVSAQDKHQHIENQAPKTNRPHKMPKEILEKYDTDKNGKLNKEERSKISIEDRKHFFTRRDSRKNRR